MRYLLFINEKCKKHFFRPVDENDIGRWRFVVYALDSSGQSAEDTLEIVVRQFSGSRLINHQLEVEFSFINWKPNIVRNWEWMVSTEGINWFYSATIMVSYLLRIYI